ncbi:MAG: hypothetical protein HOH43_23510, partial [Candidatus Latescibacteria bacterium]|nr:hypothetical protein [Candidatus Latescibacterota bacterium]
MSQARNTITDALRDPILASHLSHQEMEDFLIARLTPFQVPEADNWESEAEELRRQVLKDVIFKGIPASWYEGKPEVVWTDTIETEHGYSIKKLRYEALPNLWVPALLYEPDVLSSPAPSVLNLNGHVGPPGKAIDYKQIRCINLAKRGIIALNPEWLYFGELRTSGYTHNQAGHLDLAGAAGVGIFYLCMLRGLDVLADHEATDPERLAVTGLSGGGWQTIILSSLDKRVTLAAPNAGYVGLESRARFRGDIGDIEQNPADLVATADYPVLTAMMAPRPTLLLYNDQDDCCFRTERAHPSVYLPVKPLFEAMGVPENLAFHSNTDPGTHNYDLDHRQQFYGFLNRHFLDSEGAVDTEFVSDGEVLSEESLTVGLPSGNADFLSLATDFQADLPRFRLPSGSKDQLD